MGKWQEEFSDDGDVVETGGGKIGRSGITDILFMKREAMGRVLDVI